MMNKNSPSIRIFVKLHKCSLVICIFVIKIEVDYRHKDERGYISMDRKTLAKLIDHTLLKPNATESMIRQVVNEALEYNTATVCVNSYWIPLVTKLLAGSSVKPIAVVGFPLGSNLTDAKVAETKLAIQAGASEIDMVINLGELLAGHDDHVKKDIKAVAEATHAGDAQLKIIIETAYLNKEQIIKACQLSEEAGCDFVKTSTGFATS